MGAAFCSAAAIMPAPVARSVSVGVTVSNSFCAAVRAAVSLF